MPYVVKLFTNKASMECKVKDSNGVYLLGDHKNFFVLNKGKEEKLIVPYDNSNVVYLEIITPDGSGEKSDYVTIESNRDVELPIISVSDALDVLFNMQDSNPDLKRLADKILRIGQPSP